MLFQALVRRLDFTLLVFGSYVDKLEPGDAYPCAYQAALDEGFSAEEAEEKALAAETKERDKMYEGYVNRLVTVFEQEATYLDLEVDELKTQKGFFALNPKSNWTASAQKVRSVIQGVDGWWMPTFKEFMEASSCGSSRQVVADHLGYIGDVAKLYGHCSAERRMGT